MIADPVYLNERAELKQPWYACPNNNDLEYLKSLPASRWREAAPFAEAHACKALGSGDEGSVETASVWTHNTCLRIGTAKRCLWFPEELVQSADQPTASLR